MTWPLNPFHSIAVTSTLMPLSFRGILVALMIANLILVCVWDYFVVNRMLPQCKNSKEMDTNNQESVKRSQQTAKESLLDSVGAESA